MVNKGNCCYIIALFFRGCKLLHNIHKTRSIFAVILLQHFSDSKKFISYGCLKMINGSFAWRFFALLVLVRKIMTIGYFYLIRNTIGI